MLKHDIRVATKQDLPQLLAWGKALHFVEKEFEPLLKYSDFESQKRYIQEIDNMNSLFLIAEDDGAPVGYLYAHLDKIDYLSTKRLSCKIEVVFLEKAARGQGIARSLVGQCVEWAKLKNAFQVIAGVYADNDKSVNLFESMHFEKKHITLKHDI